MRVEGYVDFDVETCSSLPAINICMVNWRVSSVKACMTKYLRKECNDLNEVVSDNDDDKDDDDDGNDYFNSKDFEVPEIGTAEALFSKEERNSLVAMKDKLEKIKVLNKKQSHINDYFMLTNFV